MLKGHAASVTVASALCDQKEQMPAEQMPALNTVTASSDSTVRFWKRNSGTSGSSGMVLKLILSFPLSPCESIARAYLWALRIGRFSKAGLHE